MLPNVRKMFVPDPGYVIFDCDLVGADAQVVAWEAADDDLKKAFRAGLDVHTKNAEDMWGLAFTQISDPGRKRKKRKECKAAVHATNYGARPRTLAKTLGWTVREAEAFQSRWLHLHPGIRDWHRRIESYLRQPERTVQNAFGYRIRFFDRPENCFTSALAWIPQSTVAIVCFEGALQLEERCPWVEMLLQNHDSVVFQIPESYMNCVSEIKSSLAVAVPYDDPLWIPWDVACSRISWGDCEPLVA